MISFNRTLARYLAPLSAMLIAAFAASTLYAAPDMLRTHNVAPATLRAPLTLVGPARVSLDATAGAVPVGSSFDFTAQVAYAEPVEYLEARMRIRHPSGRLIYQKTFVEQSLEPGSSSFVFQREIDDIGLVPGVYPVELSVRVADDSDDVFDAVVNGELRVYDPVREPSRIVPIVRISAQPLTDPNGRFVSDPGQFTRARDDVSALAEYVLVDPDARLTLALSPVMLAEWDLVADGYSFAGAEGEIVVDASGAVPTDYAEALENLSLAAETGRLELLSTGYSDPDLCEMREAGLDDDVGPQYALGEEVVEELLQSQVSSGTAPAGLSIPEQTAASLRGIGITYMVADARFARAGGAVAAPGVYRERSSDLAVLVADSEASGLMDPGSREALFASTFRSHLDLQKRSPLPLLVTVGPRRLEAASLIGSLRALQREDWMELTLGGDVADGEEAPRVRLEGRGADESAPSDYWPAVAEARTWVRALASAYATATPDIEVADRNSLIAQGSAWAGVNNEWTPAWRGLAFATQSRGVAEEKLKTVTLDVKPVTLAGTSGQVPVTISSEASETLQLTLVQEAGRSVRLGSAAERSLAVSPGENFVQLPVELVNVLSGDLRVSLHAADIELADDTVRLRASYLDRLALVAAVVAVLLALLVFIITRVRAAQSSESDAESPGRR